MHFTQFFFEASGTEILENHLSWQVFEDLICGLTFQQANC